MVQIPASYSFTLGIDPKRRARFSLRSSSRNSIQGARHFRALGFVFVGGQYFALEHDQEKILAGKSLPSLLLVRPRATKRSSYISVTRTICSTCYSASCPEPRWRECDARTRWAVLRGCRLGRGHSPSQGFPPSVQSVTIASFQQQQRRVADSSAFGHRH